MFNPDLANSLPNGAQIINRVQRRDGVWVWLGYFAGHAMPYVTWLANASSPGATYWGHYHETVEKAADDFHERTE